MQRWSSWILAVAALLSFAEGMGIVEEDVVTRGPPKANKMMSAIRAEVAATDEINGNVSYCGKIINKQSSVCSYEIYTRHQDIPDIGKAQLIFNCIDARIPTNCEARYEFTKCMMTSNGICMQDMHPRNFTSEFIISDFLTKFFGLNSCLVNQISKRCSWNHKAFREIMCDAVAAGAMRQNQDISTRAQAEVVCQMNDADLRNLLKANLCLKGWRPSKSCVDRISRQIYRRVKDWGEVRPEYLKLYEIILCGQDNGCLFGLSDIKPPGIGEVGLINSCDENVAKFHRQRFYEPIQKRLGCYQGNTEDNTKDKTEDNSGDITKDETEDNSSDITKNSFNDANIPVLYFRRKTFVIIIMIMRFR